MESGRQTPKIKKEPHNSGERTLAPYPCMHLSVHPHEGGEHGMMGIRGVLKIPFMPHG